MVAASLTSIFIMIILLQVGNSCAQPLQGAKKSPAVKEIMIRLEESSLVMLKEEIHDISATSELKNIRPGGRKMMLKTVFNKEQQVRKEALNGEDAEISGKDIYASKKHSGKSEHLTKQNELNKAVSARRLVDPSTGTRQDCFQHSSSASTRCRAGTSSKLKRSLLYEPEGSYQSLEPQQLTDAGNEILNLMGKDYLGTPSHKSPIHNYEPLGQEHVKP